MLPAKLGQALMLSTNALDAIENVSLADAKGIIGVVVTAIQAIVSSIRKAAAKREIAYANARCWYLANARGMHSAHALANLFDGNNKDKSLRGYWRYPRASIAEDRAVPYWDPLGDVLELPTWLLPAPLGPDDKSRWPTPDYNPWPSAGNTLPIDCTNWTNINLGKVCHGAINYRRENGEWVEYSVPDPVLIGWPWAYPMTSPARLAGLFTETSAGPERDVCALYMLPTPQHVLTYARDVADSKKVLLRAMGRWFPKAYEAEPGTWRNKGREAPEGPWAVTSSCGNNPSKDGKDADGYLCGYPTAPDGGPNVPGSSFTALGEALSRIRGFELCRAAILADPQLLPDETRKLLEQNEDFKDAGKPTGKKPTGPDVGPAGPAGPGGLAGGRVSPPSSPPASRLGKVVVVGGAAVAAYFLFLD